ncbi:hypothetical protein BMS3Bbin04_00464 [bacterium BMS3Bbin04]|nr:hypothetical protein BMS3Bbin04_00464 [bacterium BMS3Bbin04]
MLDVSSDNFVQIFPVDERVLAGVAEDDIRANTLGRHDQPVLHITAGTDHVLITVLLGILDEQSRIRPFADREHDLIQTFRHLHLFEQMGQDGTVAHPLHRLAEKAARISAAGNSGAGFQCKSFR